MIDPQNFDRLHTLDLHAAGEPCRVIYPDLWDLPGETQRDKRDYMAKHFDKVRSFAMCEPRGHRDMFGSVLTKPSTPDGDVGILYLTTGGFLDMCGHGTLCSAAAIKELKIPTKNPNQIFLDAPAGRIIVSTLPPDEKHAAPRYCFQNVPSFVLTPEPVPIQVESMGTLHVSLVFAGNLFVLVEYPYNERLAPSTEYGQRLLTMGLQVREAANQQLLRIHPLLAPDTKVDLTVFYQIQKESPLHVKNAVIFGNGQLDRSPCGSGTSALMTFFNHHGQLSIGAPYLSESIIGTFFEGSLVEKRMVQGVRTVIPQVIGTPFVTGRSEFVRSTADELSDGFLIS